MVNAKKQPAVEAIQFSADTYVLHGYLHRPPSENPPFVIGCHGLFSDKNSPKQIELADQCIRHDMAYFRFDHRGCGDSNAPFNVLTSLAARCRDLKAAAKLLAARGDLGDLIGLFGSSMGGSVCLASAHDLAAGTVVTWAAPLRSADLARLHDPAGSDPTFPFKNNPFDISESLAGLKRVLVLHGGVDETVPLAHADEIYGRLEEPKKRVVFPHSDHRMSRPKDQQAFLREAIVWFKAFLKPL